MPEEYLSEILEDDTRLTRYWQERDAQLRIDRDIINMVRPKQTTDSLKWLDNEPRVFFDTARSLVSSNPPTFRLPMSINPEAEEKQRMNKAERLLIGAWRAQDQRAGQNGNVAWLYDLAYWVLLGGAVDFTYINKCEDGKPEFVSDLWDPLTVFPEWVDGKMRTLVRHYDVDAITANSMASDLMTKAQYSKDFHAANPDERHVVINWWKQAGDKVFNCVVVAGQIVKPKTLQKKMDHIPIHVTAVGDPDRVSTNWQSRRWQSIIAANRDMYGYKNTMLSLMATILAETAYPNIVSKTRSGVPAVKAEDMKGYGAVVPLRTEESIELLKHAATPTEANYLLTYINQQIQKGSLPSSVYGNLPFEVSGFALSQLLAAVKYKIGPYLQAMQGIMSRISSDWLYQYKTGKWGKVTLSVTNPYDLRRGLTYIEQYSPDDVPEQLYVEVTIPIVSQFDKTQAILNARQALTPPQLFSRETLWETELGIQDTEQELQRIRQDQVMDDPFIKQIEIIEALQERYDTYITQGLYPQAAAVKRYKEGLEIQLGMRKASLVLPGQGQGASSGALPSPNQRPPEMSMSPNPDQMNAMRGQPPPSPTRTSGQGVSPFAVSNTVNLASAQRGAKSKPGAMIL